MIWTIEKRKQGMEIWATSSTGLNGQLAFKPDAIFIGECYNAKERERTHYLADIIVEALNKAESQDKKDEEDYEQLFSAIERIGCYLKQEPKVMLETLLYVAEQNAKNKNKESSID